MGQLVLRYATGAAAEGVLHVFGDNLPPSLPVAACLFGASGGASSSAKQRYIAACKEVADVFALYTGEKNSLPDTPRFREFHDEHGKPRAELTYEQFKRECQDRELNQFTLHVAGP